MREEDIGTFFGEAERDRTTDAAIGAGDEGGAAGEFAAAGVCGFTVVSERLQIVGTAGSGLFRLRERRRGKAFARV